MNYLPRWRTGHGDMQKGRGRVLLAIAEGAIYEFSHRMSHWPIRNCTDYELTNQKLHWLRIDQSNVSVSIFDQWNYPVAVHSIFFHALGLSPKRKDGREQVGPPPISVVVVCLPHDRSWFFGFVKQVNGCWCTARTFLRFISLWRWPCVIVSLFPCFMNHIVRRTWLILYRNDTRRSKK